MVNNKIAEEVEKKRQQQKEEDEEATKELKRTCIDQAKEKIVKLTCELFCYSRI